MQNQITPQPGHYLPTVFSRHNRPLHAVWLESQAWFCASDFGRLMGRYLDGHALRKLDADQTRTAFVLQHGGYQDTLLVSESGIYTILVHHYLPENRALRHWLTHDVIAVLRDQHDPHADNTPNLSLLKWHGFSLSMLHWQNEEWFRLRDLPSVAKHPGFTQPLHMKPGKKWWSAAGRLFS